ncbi:TPA: uracil-DNA glycosylase [Patescibacteria group bacterium]|nr:MAG: Uracil-DNA glycosylase [Parcubacteria group bacterium GW2011_GWD2_42_14]HCC05666.1 uracil-DNA glycosylase [Patescibacteria group bacterium]
MTTDVRIEESWKSALRERFETPEWKMLSEFVKSEYKVAKVYPPPKCIFNAFDLCSFEKVKVVILGQDPYHGTSQAHGLCFSVPEGVPIPPSLKNIYKELNDDVGILIPTTGNLEKWAEQGVLLLNATLTVRAGQPGSHQNKGWEEFTDAVIRKISNEKERVVFMLWGNYAKAKRELIDTTKHFVLEAAHPSPFSAYNGFFGCKHFSRANEYLRANGKEVIEW